MKSRIVTSNIWLVLFTLLFIVSCASNTDRNETTEYAVQPGDRLNTYLLENRTQTSNVNELLLQYKGSKSTEHLINQYRDEITKLFADRVFDITASMKSEEIKARLQPISAKEATALFSLFPIDTAKWMKLISSYSNLTQSEIYESAITAGLDPSVVFAASAAGFENTATPLINSIGLVIYGQDESSTATVRYRADDETSWRSGLNLSWEPVYGSLAGSVVYLNADTIYHIEVQVTDQYGVQQEHVFQTRTKPNSPPIDPEKIYYLSDIYSGGQLDLEALNISGNANGYAKIIGDGQVIEASSDVLAAVNIGAQSYVMLENLVIKGGQRYGIFAKKAHHIWIKGCNISEFGREAVDIRDGLAYSSPTTNSPINYDSGIYLERSGIAVIEECEVHSPNLGANSWEVGHPKGANALQVWAYHDSDAYRGEFIVRNNRFYGAPNHRFNDVIEGRKNFERRGGFVKNSAIYGNYLAYANDDLIEIDGGQQNVLVYGNEMEQGYAGISIAPNMLGPSYIFHNYIHNLGDETGKEWTAIKAGGLMARPAGKTYVFENFIDVNRNGIAASGVNGDTTFWIESQNNIIFTDNTGYSVGYCIFDKEKFFKSVSTNDLCFNRKTMDARNEFNLGNLVEHPRSDDLTYIDSLTASGPTSLEIDASTYIPNFSDQLIDTPLQQPIASSAKSLSENFWTFNTDNLTFSHFAKQYDYGETTIEGKTSISITGNNWVKIPISYEISSNTEISLSIQVEGAGTPEIVGVGFETDNTASSSRLVRFYGTQDWGIDAEEYFSSSTSEVNFPLGEYIQGYVRYIVLALDYDDINPEENSTRVTFSDLTLSEAESR
ncbi:right-handed parallel beta-helix repeat-containing protein [Alteromonas gracilis]|uniref:right-handed parallel beta-helix repeat-containing protein n=1 Tax=Alteromonas gracilis TaxID=1479524 RepID=UPI003734D297